MKTKYIKITNGLFYRKTSNGNIVLARKQFTKLTLKKNEIKKLIEVLREFHE